MKTIRELVQTLTRRIGILNKSCCCVEGAEVSVVQSHILYEINRQHQPSIQQIAETLGMDVTTFSRQVQSMVEAGLVKKTPYAEDRRVQILSLTDKGKRIHDAIEQIMTTYYHDIFSHMTEFEKETVIRSLQLFNQAMAKTRQCCNPMGD